jgi:hypothetical protein
MWSELEKVFVEIGLDYSRQGSYSDDAEYPPAFFTFWNYDTPEEGFYDNEANRAVWYWQVYYYTNDPSTLYAGLENFISKAEDAGFIAEGKGTDIPSDRSDYFGRMVAVKWVEQY